jgi:alpha-ribazole phosphatase/probable phosphoglycerate mutase
MFMETCRVYLVRHGETQWNADRRVQGFSDVPLSEIGREQVRSLAQKLALEKFSCFYSSDLDRAYETALILAQPHGLPIHKTTALRELNFGAWEGLTMEEVEKINPGMMEKWWRNPLDRHVPEGEKLTELIERCETIMKDIIKKHMGEKVVVVAHGATIRSIICSVLCIRHSELWRIFLDNACLTRIDFPNWNNAFVRGINLGVDLAIEQ